MAKLLSNKVKKVPSNQADPNRFDFISLEHTEPDLGVPSSNNQVLISNIDGTRSWSDNLELDTLVVNSETELNGNTTINGRITVNGVDTQTIGSNSELIENYFGENISTVNLSVENPIDGQVDDISNHNTDDLAEGNTNLYYTDERVRAAVSASGDLDYDANTGEFSVTTYKSTDFDADLATKTTNDLTEGNTNLYYTDQRAIDAVEAAAKINLNDLSVANIDYPTVDGLNGQVITTDGAGNLSFENPIANGGLTDQILVKSSNADFDTEWTSVPTVKGLQLDIADPADDATGRIIWNDGDEVPQFVSNGVKVDLGLELLARCRNVTGNTIPKGTAVCIVGASANRISIAPSDRAIPGSACRTIGLTIEEIPTDEFGKVSTFGLVRGLNTDAFDEGDELYVGETPGSLTSVEPTAPARRLTVGYVVTKNTNIGQIFVTLRRGVRVNEIDDVEITSLTDKDILRYSNTNSRWENQELTTDLVDEGNTNLYFTTQRVRDSLSANGDLNYNANTGVFSVITYKTTDFNTDFAGKTTNDLAEGANNLYFTTERINDHLFGTNGITYSNGEISIGQPVDITANVLFDNITLTGTVILGKDPVSANSAATKRYVDEIAQGLQARSAAQVLVDQNISVILDPDGFETGWATITASANGAFPTTDGIDSTELNVVGKRFLFISQTNQEENGLYVLIEPGTESTPWVLRRCKDCRAAEQVPGSFVFVELGTKYASTGWVATVDNPSTFQVNVDPIIWIQFSGAGTFVAGDGLELNANEFKLANTAAGAFLTYTSGVLSVNATANNTANTVVARNANGSFTANTITATDFNSTSDERFKYNIEPIESALEKTMQLNGVSFQWKETDEAAIGLIAQQVERIIPSAVKETDGIKTVSYGNLVGLLIEAIKDQQKQIEELKTFINKN